MQSNPRPDLPLSARLQQDLKNDLIAGLLVVIPLATTFWLATTVSRFVLAFLTSIPKQFNPFITLNPLLQDLINLALGLTVPLFAILLIGLMARNIVGRWLLEFGEETLQRIPLAGSVYKTLKQLLATFLRDNSQRFRRVVLVEYPREGLYSVGFVTGVVGPSLQAELTEPLLSVFIPTAPNPTTGWYTLVPETSVKDLDISVEDAFRTIISAGIVNPDEREAPVNRSFSSLISQAEGFWVTLVVHHWSLTRLGPMSMQSRSLSRELALLVLGQCPERVDDPPDLSLDTLLQKALDSLMQHWTEVLDCCAGDLEKAQQHLLESELKDGPSSDQASVRESLQSSLTGAEQVLNGLSASLELPRLLALSNQDQVRREAMQRVTFVLKKRKAIDQLLDGVMEGWRLTRLPRIDRDILRLAVIDLSELHTPAAVACNEAVELAHRFSDEQGRKMINGVLRRLQNAPSLVLS